MFTAAVFSGGPPEDAPVAPAMPNVKKIGFGGGPQRYATDEYSTSECGSALGNRPL